MPIQCRAVTGAISEDEFNLIDYRVVGCAFQVQNRFGRLCDELAYKRKMKELCLKQFNKVELEVPISLIYKSYSKNLFIDALINGSALYEFKATGTITGCHVAQTLNYLFLTDLHYGKILNFRPTSVEQRPLATTITSEGRQTVVWHDTIMGYISDDGKKLRDILEELIADWGSFLTSSIYMDAVSHFWGGREKVICPIEVSDGDLQLGHKHMSLLNPRESFVITTFTDKIEENQNSIQKLLDLTKLTTLYWINLNHHQITFIPLVNKQSITPVKQ